jgi:hypothetical protein
MKRMRKQFQSAAVFGLLFMGVATAQEVVDGVYMMPIEVSGFSGETLELSHGRFRYWFYSDVVTGKEPKYPLTGAYEVHSNSVCLLHGDIFVTNRAIMTIQGHTVLWREDGLLLWQSEQRIFPYAVLLRVSAPPLADTNWPKRPSMRLLYDQQMIDRDQKEYQERFNVQPEPVRSILRAYTKHDDPDMIDYKKAILWARREMNPTLIEQLVSLLGYETKYGVTAKIILDEIYTKQHITGEEPSFLKTSATRRKALENLINAMTKAKDHSAIEDCLALFLCAANVREVDLSVPEAGVRIWIERDGDSITYRSGETGSSQHPKSYKWFDEMSVIVPVCQKWCRVSIDKSRIGTEPTVGGDGIPGISVD